MEETTDSPNKPKRPNPWVARVLGVVTLLCVFIPALFWKGGVLEGEAISFIINYADDRSVLQKVFAVQLNDFDTFQARELSFFFDYLDASFYLFLLRHFDVALFIPLSALVSSILIILIYRRGLRRTLPGIDRLTAELSLLPFLTCFVFVSTMGVFYRSGKPLLAPVLLALMFHLLGAARSRTGRSTLEKGWAMVNRQSLITFGLFLVAALLDRQGFFYVLISFSVLLVHFLITRRLKDLLIASGAAAILAHLYNWLLGPAIVWAVNAYRVDFFYQRIPVEELAKLPAHAVKAGWLLIANMAALLGGYYVVGYLVLSVIIGWLVWRTIGLYKERVPGKFRERYASGASLGIIYALMVLALQVVMFALMLARHRFIYDWVDHWYWYYSLPFLMTVLFGLALLLNALLPRMGTIQRRVLRVALVLIAISNLLHLPANRKLMLTSQWFSQEYPLSEMLKASVRHHWRHPDLDEEYTRFFLFHEQQRKSVK
ncbi:MAG TPA: hypothetical protein VEX43_00015 [Chthoniobacterales bacterium]|nr:hypothetical protein [Chthoniobacterales bacterium]